jgi:hypothetical protein
MSEATPGVAASWARQGFCSIPAWASATSAPTSFTRITAVAEPVDAVVSSPIGVGAASGAHDFTHRKKGHWGGDTRRRLRLPGG